MMVTTARNYQHHSLAPHSTDRNTLSHYSSVTYYTASTASDLSLPFTRISDGPGVGRDLNTQQSRYPLLPSSTSTTRKSRPSKGTVAMHSKFRKHLIPRSSTPTTAAGHPEAYYSPSFTSPAFGGAVTAIPDPHASYSPSSTPKPKTKMKPLLRRFSPRENNSLDLSRSATEHEGLGIYASDGTGSRSAADVTFPSVGKRGAAYHARSTSGASQYSTATSGSNPRPGAQYVHPKRQTPRPYTPPITHSYTNSILESEHSGEGTGIGTDTEDGEYVREHLRQARMRAERSHSLSQQQAMQQPMQPPLRIMTTTGSATRLVYGSQQNLPGTPTSLRPRADTMSPAGTISPVSRTSIDNVFKFRGKDDSASFNEKLDVEREAFQRKQGAKAQKAKKEELKAAEREMHEREKREEDAVKKSVAREERVRRKSESKEKSKGRSGSTTEADVIGQEYSKLGSLPSSRGHGSKGNSKRTSASGTSQGGLRNRWTAFMVWLRFRIFKLGRKSG
ncbi:hypothetical protein GP486_006755 [Trichoglossum hirsutum]|uniref:Uncharacterized protein n=1 Tax=Trichoglossum hirsutum TaxID=265104 RepID=A0A9P8L784_9PEZI|nr:hypothetical protein GP486_006755 [Trichoglossum hirsutum]